MSVQSPFNVSPRAETFLRTLRKRPGLEMGLVLAHGFETKEPDGAVTDQYRGTHFYVGWNERAKWSGDRITIAGLKLWLSNDVAGALRGKTLTILQRDKPEGHIDVKELLVAV